MAPLWWLLLPIWDYFGAVIANLGPVGCCPTQDVSPFPFVLEFLTLYWLEIPRPYPTVHTLKLA